MPWPRPRSVTVAAATTPTRGSTARPPTKGSWTGRYTRSQMVRLTSTRRGCVQYSPNFPIPKDILQDLGLVVRLFGRDEFGYDGDENTADCRLAMYSFAIQRPGKPLG